MRIHALLTSGLLLLGTAGSMARAEERSPKAKKEATPAAAKPTAQAELKGLDGKTVGTATFTETPQGVLIAVDLTSAKPGEHALHIHEVGKCEPPFKSAGGHFNPGMHRHGFLDEAGGHAGDLPNIHIPESGKLKVELLAPGVTLASGDKNSVFDADGSALVIHAKADDYRTDPAGGAGDRIACGVLRATM